MVRSAAVLIAVTGILFAAGCGQDSVVVSVNGNADTLVLSIEIVDESSILVEEMRLEVGDTARLDATALNALGHALGGVVPVWTSTRPSVASVSSEGEVAAVGAGNAVVSAYYAEVTATVPVIVTEPVGPPPPTFPVATILTPSRDTTINLGESVFFTGRGADADGTVVSHGWAFGDGEVSSQQNPGTYVFDQGRTYGVTYVVTDDDGNVSPPARREVVVIDPANPPPPPPASEVVFLANWDQGLGTSLDAVTDGGVFVDWGGGAQGGGFEVKRTSTEGRDFSTPNYLQIAMVGGQDWVDMISGNWARPQVGETITASWEMRWTSPVGGQTTHGFYFDDDFGGTNWGPPTLGLSIEDNLTSWQVTLWTSERASPDLGPISAALPFPLSKSETYEVEISYTRVSNNQFQAGIDIKDMSGATLFGSTDFGDFQWYFGERMLSETTFTMSGAGASGMTGFRVGNNGLDVRTGPNQQIAEIANFRVSISGN